MKAKILHIIFFLSTLGVLVTPARAQGTAFTYQGRLTEAGAAANGVIDFTFTLYNAEAGGATVGANNVVNDLAVTNGLFTVTLDFGAGAFDGSARWLQIALRPGAATGAYTNLTPRQSIAATPYAVRALEAAAVPSAAITSAMLANGAVTSAKIAPGAVNQLGSPDGTPLAALQVNTDGFVGIGTATPLSALHIAATRGSINYELASVRVDESGGYTNLGGAYGVAVQGNLLAVAAYSDSGITLMDITDPAAPVLRSQIRDGEGAFTNLGGAQSVALKPNLLAVAASTDQAVTLINVTDPSNPVKLAELQDGVGGFNELDFVDVVAISGNLMAMAGQAVTLADISNPAVPVKRAEIKQGVGGFNLLSGVESIALSGNLLAIGSSFPDRAVTLVDVSNPASPVKRAEIVNGVDGYDSLGRISGLALSGGLLAIASQTAEAVTLVDVTNPGSPVRRAVLKHAVNATDLTGAFGVALSNGQLAVGGRSSVSVFDVTSPANPVELGVARNTQGEFQQLTDPWSVAFAGSNVVTASPSSYAVTIIAPRIRPSSLTTAGWVGIGTTRPGTPLHVVGDVRVDQANRVELNTTHFEAGTDTAAIGFGSTALGYQSTASGNYSSAIGYLSQASGLYSTALGYRAIAMGQSATAIGSFNTARGLGSLALGSGTQAEGDYSTTFGRSTYASGLGSTAFGNSTAAIGEYATALGKGSVAQGRASVAMGYYAQALHDHTFVWADETGGILPSFASSASNQFLVRASGGVGINTNDPNGAALAVNGDVSVTGLIRASGGVGINTSNLNGAALAVNGDVSISGTLNSPQFVNFAAAGASLLRLDPVVDAFYGNSVNARIGTGNIISDGVHGGFVAGGSELVPNRVSGDYASVLGGWDNTASGRYATAFGANTEASGQASLALGSGTKASGLNSLAGGSGAVASGDGSLSIGYNTTASGRFSTALGYYSQALHNGSFVWGDETVATYVSSTAPNQFLVRASGGVGINTNNPQGAALAVNGDTSVTGNLRATGTVALGGNAAAAGFGAVALGGGQASANYSTAIGGSASGGGSVAIGNGAAATAPNSFALGSSSQARHSGSFVCSDATGVALTSTAPNQFLIQAGGGVGIGTGNPQGSVHVYSANNPTVMRLQSSGTPGFGRVEFVSNPQGDVNEWRPGYIQSSDSGGFTGGLRFVVNGAGVANKFAELETMRIVNGRVGIGTSTPVSTLQVVGTVTATAFNPPSDRNLKENFSPVSPREMLEKVASLPISRWNFKGDAATPHVGPMAQDFYAAFGTGTDERHIATVDADGVALAAIQGLNEKLEVRSQHSEVSIRQLQTENAELKAQLAELKAAVKALAQQK